MIQTKTIYKLLCYIPYYFLIVITTCWYFSPRELFYTPPPPSLDGTFNLPTLGAIMNRILLVHTPALLGYIVISFPFIVFLLIWLIRNNEFKKWLFIHFAFYLLVVVVALFSIEIFMLLK